MWKCENGHPKSKIWISKGNDTKCVNCALQLQTVFRATFSVSTMFMAGSKQNERTTHQTISCVWVASTRKTMQKRKWGKKSHTDQKHQCVKLCLSLWQSANKKHCYNITTDLSTAQVQKTSTQWSFELKTQEVWQSHYTSTEISTVIIFCGDFGKRILFFLHSLFCHCEHEKWRRDVVNFTT